MVILGDVLWSLFGELLGRWIFFSYRKYIRHAVRVGYSKSDGSGIQHEEEWWLGWLTVEPQNLIFKRRETVRYRLRRGGSDPIEFRPLELTLTDRVLTDDVNLRFNLQSIRRARILEVDLNHDNVSLYVGQSDVRWLQRCLFRNTPN